VSNNRLSKTNNNGDVDINFDGDDITKISTTVLGEKETTSTTTFTNQNPTNILRVVSDVPHSREIVSSATTGNLDQRIASFMAKPVVVRSGSITPANLANSLVFRFSIAAELIANPIWANKIAGFLNLRGTAKVRLQVNANPFQAGRLLLCYIPQYEHSPRTFACHLNSLMQKTQLPHVEMSLQDTESELIIPYIAPTTYYNRANGFYDWGTVFCYIYSPVAVGAAGNNQVTYSAWLSFDDFELEVPIVPQAGGFTVRSKKDVIKKYRVNAIKSNLDSEVNEGKGPISSILSNVSSIATTLYSVPMLAPIAGPSAWFTNMMSGVASSFGWSKPILDSQVCRMFSNPHAYIANVNTSDVTNSLGLIADNKVSVMPDVCLSGVDEMSLSFIKKQKAWFQTTTWSSTTLPGAMSRFLVSPAIFQSFPSQIPFGAASDLNPMHLTPIALLAKLYRFWRGSIEITIKIVKTQYHTGRLIVSLSPGSGTGPITNSDTNYLHREIIDLRDGSEFCISIPYCSNTMYMNTDTGADSNFPFYWFLHVSVLNELVAPETVSQSVELLYEVRGGDDLEFQCPIPFNMTPSQTIVPQSGGDAQAAPILCNPIGGSTIHDANKMASQLCVGEHSTSILQLLKRYTKLSSNLLWTGNGVNIYPYLWGGYYTTGVAGGGTSGALTNDYLGLFAGCYAHSRGGVRYRILTDAVSEADTSAGSFIGNLVPFDEPSTNYLTFIAASANEQLGLSPQVIANSEQLTNGVMTFDTAYVAGTSMSVPMYSRTFTRLNKIMYNNDWGGALPSKSPDTSVFALKIISSAPTLPTQTAILRCASDDFQFSFWLGVPAVGWINP